MKDYLNAEAWENQWQNQFDTRQNMYSGESGLGYWEKRADDFSEMRVSMEYEYGNRVYEALKDQLPEKASVLDIGAGPGTFLVPFAPKVGKFTALEPAANMIANLERNAARAGIDNYEVIDSTWEISDPVLESVKYDLVLISITLWMFRDIRERILAKEKLSKNLCCIVTGAGDDPSGHGMSLWQKVMGETPKPAYSEFPFAFNLLYMMGRRPEVRIISHQAERSVPSRIRQQELFYEKYTTLDDDKRRIIHDHVMEVADQNGGVSLEKYTSAVIFWKV